MIALVSIVFSMVLSGVVSYYDSLEIIKNSTMVESEYIRSGIEQQADYLSHISSAGYGTGAQSVRVTLVAWKTTATAPRSPPRVRRARASRSANRRRSTCSRTTTRCGWTTGACCAFRSA